MEEGIIIFLGVCARVGVVDVHGLVIERTVEPSDVTVLEPIDRLRRDSFEVIFSFSPSTPGRVF